MTGLGYLCLELLGLLNCRKGLVDRPHIHATIQESGLVPSESQ